MAMNRWMLFDKVIPSGDEQAVQDVLLEREAQIRKGYTPEHDMQHSPNQLVDFGQYYHDTPSRAELVRLAACTLAAIARIDADNTTNTDQEDAHE